MCSTRVLKGWPFSQEEFGKHLSTHAQNIKLTRDELFELKEKAAFKVVVCPAPGGKSKKEGKVENSNHYKRAVDEKTGFYRDS